MGIIPHLTFPKRSFVCEGDFPQKVTNSIIIVMISIFCKYEENF